MRPDLDRPWHELPIVFIDTESTGLPDDGGRCCEIAAVRYKGGMPVARFSCLIDPGCEMPQAATAVHGITSGMVKGAPKLEDVAGDLMRVCAGAVPAAYNAPFDKHMLHASITGVDCLAFDPAPSWLDVMIICKHFDRYVSGAGRHKLVNACKRHGIVIEGAHRAEADAIGTGALLWAFKTKLGDVSAAELIRRCDVRRAEQEKEFQAWKSRQRETA